MRRPQRLIATAVLIALSGALAGCGSTGSFDPSDLLDFLDTKKKLPGDRKAVFPEGVPGLEQGVPKDLSRGARQQDDRNVREPRRPPDVLRDLIAVLAGHPDVGEHDVGRRRLEPLDRLIAVADRDDGHVLIGKRQFDDALNRDAVVGKEEGVRHSQGYR